MVTERRRFQNRDSQRRFRDRCRERERQAREDALNNQQQHTSQPAAQQEGNINAGVQQTITLPEDGTAHQPSLVNPNGFASINQENRSLEPANTTHTDPNGSASSHNGHEQGDLDDDFSQFLNSRDDRSATWQSNENTSNGIHVDPFQTSNASSTDASMQSTLEPSTFDEDIFVMPSAEEQMYMPVNSSLQRPNPRRDSAMTFASTPRHATPSQRLPPRAFPPPSPRPPLAQKSRSNNIHKREGSLRRTDRASSEVSNNHFIEELQQLLRDTKRVYEAGQIMGFLEHDDAFDRSLAWMRQRVGGKLAGPL